MKNKTSVIKTSKDIVVGQFYKALGSDGYYYIGIKIGDDKRLVVINCEKYNCEEDGNVLFPNMSFYYKDWNFQPCSQEEVMNCK